MVGVANKSMGDYDEIMHMISCMSRPVELSFSRIVLTQKLNLKTPEHNTHRSKSHLSTKEHYPITPSLSQFKVSSDEYDRIHKEEEDYPYNGQTDFLSPTRKMKSSGSPRGGGLRTPSSLSPARCEFI